MTLSRRFVSCTGRRTAVATLVLVLTAAAPAAEAAIFNYGAISDPILSATFAADFAALTAHRTFGGFEVNSAALVDMSGVLADFILSGALFGNTDAAIPDPALIDQGTLGTGVFTVVVAPSFFPALASGSVGLLATFTDTSDGLFAIDYVSLTIQTASGMTTAIIGLDDGFGIGVPDGGTLAAELPASIPFGATGTGFDEAVTSVSLRPQPAVPDAGTLLLLGTGLAAAGVRRWRHRR